MIRVLEISFRKKIQKIVWFEIFLKKFSSRSLSLIHQLITLSLFSSFQLFFFSHISTQLQQNIKSSQTPKLQNYFQNIQPNKLKKFLNSLPNFFYFHDFFSFLIFSFHITFLPCVSLSCLIFSACVCKFLWHFNIMDLKFSLEWKFSQECVIFSRMCNFPWYVYFVQFLVSMWYNF